MSSITGRFFPALATELASAGRTGILVSGGADSEILLRAAADVLGPAGTVAFIAETPFLAGYYKDIVQRVTQQLGVTLIKIPLNLLNIDAIKQNTPERCYHCKRAIYSTITNAAKESHITALADGTNMSDLSEHRPGLRAAEELRILHPFANAQMQRTDVIELGKLLKMPDTLRPPDSCLATRIPENTAITPEILDIIEKIEQPVRTELKGRLRAMVSGTHIKVEFQSIDRLPVETHRQELKNLAETNGFRISFHENT